MKRISYICAGCVRYNCEDPYTRYICSTCERGSRYIADTSPQKDHFHIKKVIFNDPATIVLWRDGFKTVVKCGEGDIFDPEKSLAMAIAKRALGNQGNYYDHIKKWLPEEELSSKKTMGGNEYISRPVKIRAIQWTGSNTDELEDFLGIEDLIYQDIITWANEYGPGYFKIKTLEGPMLAAPGDYIIKGLRNEFYPCKPDVFKKKYRLMDDE